MSESDYFTSLSSTDEEHEEGLNEVERLKNRDELLDRMWELFRRNNIESYTNGIIDGNVVNEWLRGSTHMEDILVNGHLKKTDSTVYYENITNDRVAEFREAARAVVKLYNPVFFKFRHYIDDVAASIMKYHYKL